MNTPIADFVKSYALSDISRLHMPGHKGRAVLGCEPFDITEIAGADSLYEADGIIARSEENAAALFGSRRTFYATGGSSQCVRAMLHLLVTLCPANSRPVILAARNVHKSFVHAAALIGFEVVWLWPEGSRASLCACPVTAEQLERALDAMDAPPAAVYLTSPDYLGGIQDIAALSRVCHDHGTRLAVDNAHGSYLHFCEPAMHPMDLGADICCDSAHKTLPVLTGGAYLHLSRSLPEIFDEQAREALVLFGSTSPSYLTMCSLDMCNAYLADGYRQDLAETIGKIDRFCLRLAEKGWKYTHDEPLKVTIHASLSGVSGHEAAERLRKGGIEMEYADPDDVVLMISPMNRKDDLEKVLDAIGMPGARVSGRMPLPVSAGKQAMTIREAFFAPRETISVNKAAGRICAVPTVSCPPAIPIAVSGEIITEEAVRLFEYYGMKTVKVLKANDQ
ncbi:MAG: PLP-dependent transferase [Clostridia bacterium]|nr:PLP-dependent transferase [Clostridia bacterium]